MVHESHSQEFILAAAIGSIVGGVAVLFLTPKSGKKMCKDICDCYSNVSEKACDVIQKGKSLINKGNCKICDWGETSGNTAHNIVNCLSNWLGSKEKCNEKCSTTNLLIGGLLGSAVGATAGFLLAPKSGEKFRQDLSDHYEEAADVADRYLKRGKSFAKRVQSRADRWLDFAKELVDEFTEETGDTSQHWRDKAKEILRDERARKIFDWASLGYRAWDRLKSKR